MDISSFDKLLISSQASSSLVGRRGYCAPTKDSAAGDCNSGSKGSWPLQGTTPLASCLQRCAENCARCRFVSFSPSNLECSWYHDCDLEHLETRYSRDHQTMAVASHWAELKQSLVLAPRSVEARPLCDANGRDCVQVVAYDTENTDMYPPARGAAGMPLPFAVHFVHPPAWLVANASISEKLHHKFKAFQAYAAAAPAEHILMFIDSRDVVWGGCQAQTLGERFNSLNRSVVFGAELGCFPAGPYCEQFPAARDLPRNFVDCDFT